jgi:hypothetical protein
MGGSITYRFDGGSIFELQVEASAVSRSDA